MIQDQCGACASSQSIPHLPFLSISAGKPNSCAGHGTSSDWIPWCIYTGLSSWGTFWGNGVWNWRIKSEVTIVSLSRILEPGCQVVLVSTFSPSSCFNDVGSRCDSLSNYLSGYLLLPCPHPH